ncbi:hypothetical protein TRVA0_020S01684 [Trichomonascus vanleenenianus]|uniref:uncharacterized protein n=1 Tax=Trichomonascus vanleenenianus TaxID=2268995 RepID=UPI003ECB9695
MSQQHDPQLQDSQQPGKPQQPLQKLKKRKSQSEEAFEAQKEQYKQGPLIQTDNWLMEKDFGEAENKLDRNIVKNAAERAFYIKDYSKALEILDQATGFAPGSKEARELDEIRSACNEELEKLNQS